MNTVCFPSSSLKKKVRVSFFLFPKKQEDKLERFVCNVNGSTHLQLTEKIIKINDASA